ncbi:SDR family NAD(P)-dependent oxidoreductase [Ferrimonas lipolytica]|uniref:SDR family NAD(P)-dependent oxidoreductase n=1 Tax=Ferrimonas lipolytica TaxID=2724191 RepID=A0A6H1UBM7_9GAMM|nr:SDR family NAD(P)-dependent oxidoreductase [Ferrimonas lipolytica]QIZ75773.1 SDR family NAD(P)-dependent oxidoreductase [Ferrimonas lipolytica]
MALLSNKTRIMLNLFVPQRRKSDPRLALSAADSQLDGKTVVFTGGTDGIGREAVIRLHRLGAHVVILGRSEAKGQTLLAQLNQNGGNGQASFELCDLASMASVQDCVQRILSANSRIDVLVNCAGINMTQCVLTGDGFETNWAINYLGPVVLTELLLEPLKASTAGRIVNLTTNTEFIDRLDIDQIQSKPDFATNATYVESKLAMNNYSIELAQRLNSSGVTVNSLCPGYIKSNLLRYLSGTEKVMQSIMNLMASPTEVGADRIVRLVASSAFTGVSAEYVCEDKMKPHHPEAMNPSKRQAMQQLTQARLAHWL